jgi:cyclopropane fatty-acyl-phospholipid synthase-like methyltransferase
MKKKKKNGDITMTSKNSMPPDTSAAFDSAYRFPVTIWGDARIPPEIKALTRTGAPRSALELGCGIGRFSRYVAQQGIRATGVDFSKVAIARARKRVAGDDVQPEYLVGDVTRLDAISGPFDVSFDVGCFHCLDANAQRGYVSEVFRLLKTGGTHLIWALDTAPSGIAFTPDLVKEIFAPGFRLQAAQKSRRRLIRSHWYWLVRS